MIKSMTGFGAVRNEKDGNSLNIEVKCLNSKFLDLNLRLPKHLNDKELVIRNLVADKLGRGKVQINIELHLLSLALESEGIDKTLFSKYYGELKSLAQSHSANTDDLFRLTMQMPEVLKSGSTEIDKNTWAWIEASLVEALEKADEFRSSEGASMTEQFNQSLSVIRLSLESIEQCDGQRRIRQKERLWDAISEIKERIRVDENRFEQELIYYLEKLDISEEKVRLKTHLDYFEKMMASASNGKRLQFIAQEIGREINTIGSKANDASMQKFVVDMKDELEKIKEQGMNVL